MKIKNIFFDFDGVIVDSDEIKSQAFYKLFESYNVTIAKKVLAHHENNIGISRIDKFRFYLDNYIDDKRFSIKILNKKFSKLVVKNVIEAKFITGAKKFLDENYKFLNFFLCTSTPQEEIEIILKKKNIDHYFKKIYGSPLEKNIQITYILKEFKIKNQESIFIGDSINDYKSSKSCDIKFILMMNKFNDSFFKKYDVERIKNYKELHNLLFKND